MAIVAPLLYGLAGLGTVAQAAEAQGVGQSRRSEQLMDLEALMSSVSTLEQDRTRDSMEGLSSLADLVEFEATRFDPVPLDPELATLISGYEDMLTDARGSSRPSLRSAYARLGIGV
jgi:hypothetical protein